MRKKGRLTRGDKAFLVFCGALIASCVILKAIFHPVIVEGSSMEPTFRAGQVVSSRTAFTASDISRGTIVVFSNGQTGGTSFIKRIVGLPGDSIQIKEGRLLVNGQEEEEGFPLMEEAGLASATIRLRSGEYFVLGDNRNASSDSRAFGPVRLEDITNIISD